MWLGDERCFHDFDLWPHPPLGPNGGGSGQIFICRYFKFWKCGERIGVLKESFVTNDGRNTTSPAFPPPGGLFFEMQMV